MNGKLKLMHGSGSSILRLYVADFGLISNSTLPIEWPAEPVSLSTNLIECNFNANSVVAFTLGKKSGNLV